ncbi:MAG: HAD-IC family P-type ATPase [bacterium]|nr:HAD-IC family P-type ATPase [bacterium]
MNEQQTAWYRLTTDETLRRIAGDERGLSSGEAKRRLGLYGENALSFKRTGWFVRLLRQFHNPLVYILLVSASITGTLTLAGRDMLPDTIVILGVVLLNALLGFLQEGKAESALEAVKTMTVASCTALRDEQAVTLPARALVPGDVVLLEAGDRVPADLRLFAAREVRADEAALTGESVPVPKDTEAIDSDYLAPGDQTCMLFGGTFQVHGSSRGIVVETGPRTEFGKIAAMVSQTAAVLTPLQRKISDFSKTLIKAILAIGAVTFVLGALGGYPVVYSFLAAVSLVVAAIPEMLPMIVTAILALAATAMTRRRALIRRLPAAETLGCTSVICSDKTGTLTRDEMTVRRLHAGGRDYELRGVGYKPEGAVLWKGLPVEEPAAHRGLQETLTAGFLCNNATLSVEGDTHAVIGDPTEGALLVSAIKFGADTSLERLDEIPFDSERMFMAALHRTEEGNRIYVKGSPERLLHLCSEQLDHEGRVVPLDTEQICAKVDDMASQALRVIGMAHKTISAEETSISLDQLNDLTFLGLQGMLDPPREEAIEAVDSCKRAGVRTVMITGDHALTAKAVAAQLGIIEGHHESVLAGEALEAMSDEELADVVETVSVYARVAPEHKLRIAQKLQERGHVVAMTGDGVNDAPALKAADIGVAMGITGTEVSKEASSMVLLDDNFATIVGAVEEGRHAWNNIEKAILYTLPTNGGQALLVMGAVLLSPFIPLFASRLPLEPVQILWVNLLDSVFLTMPLMMEPKERFILDQPPRPAMARVIDALFLRRVVLIGLAIAVPTFLVFHHFGAGAVENGLVIDPLRLTQAQTAAFWAVLLVHFGFVMSARSVSRSAFRFSPFSNPWLLGGIAASFLVRLLPTFVPAIGGLFRTAAFPADWWWWILPCVLPGFLVLELDKLVFRGRSR